MSVIHILLRFFISKLVRKSLLILLNLPLQLFQHINKDLGDDHGKVQVHLDVLQDLVPDLARLLEQHRGQILERHLVFGWAFVRNVIWCEASPEERVGVVRTQVDLVDVEPAERRVSQ